MYIILEIQTSADGTAAALVNTIEEENTAQSEYHRVLSAAAISNVALHACTLLDSTGAELAHKCFSHIPAEEIGP